MSSIKVPTKYVKKLKELGVYDNWVCELKKFCGDNQMTIHLLEKRFYTVSEFHPFISASFRWSDTIDGFDYWYKISQK